MTHIQMSELEKLKLTYAEHTLEVVKAIHFNIQFTTNRQ